MHACMNAHQLVLGEGGEGGEGGEKSNKAIENRRIKSGNTISMVRGGISMLYAIYGVIGLATMISGYRI